jgi:tetratricopeptide (TPR) repeat protein
MVDLKEKDILNFMKSSNCVFFVGSAISMKEPSCLPDGNTLKRLVIESLCIDVEYLESLFQDYFSTSRWDKTINKLAQSMHELMPEVIFQIAEDILGGYAVKSLKFFELASHNFNHRFLSYYLKNNRELGNKSIIITTNFDYLLEKAMQDLDLEESKDFIIHTTNDDFLITPTKYIDIFKLHGSIQDETSVITTLRGIGLKLPDKKAIVLKSVLENYPVFFVGYSGLDLDIYPVINGCGCKDIYWLIEPGVPPTTQTDSLIKKFNAKVYKVDLNKMFLNLSKKFSFNIKEDKITYDDSFVRDYLINWSKAIEVSDKVHIIANVMRHIGQLSISTGLLEKVRVLYTRAKPLKRIRFFNDLGDSYTDVNNWQKAEEAYNVSFNLAKDNRQKAEMGVSKSGLAYIYYKKDQWNKAITLYSESLDLMENAGANERDILGARIGLGLTFYKQKLTDKAIENLEPTLLKIQNIGDIQTVIQARRILGLAYYQRNKGNDLEKALAQQNEAMELSLKINDDAGVIQAINNIAIIYTRQKKLDDAIEYHIRNISNREKIGDMRGKGQTYYNLGRLYPDKSVDSYQKAIEYYEKVKSPPIQDILAAYERLSKLYLLLNDFENAIKYLYKSQKKRKQLLKSGEEDLHRLANVTGELGHAYLLNGEVIKAVTQYDNMLVIYKEMNKEELGKFKSFPTERYDNAMRHLKTALGVISISQNAKKAKEFSDMINKINLLRSMG